MVLLPSCFETFCRRGGIGRRARLKILYSDECVGSSPSAGISTCSNNVDTFETPSGLSQASK